MPTVGVIQTSTGAAQVKGANNSGDGTERIPPPTPQPPTPHLPLPPPAAPHPTHQPPTPPPTLLPPPPNTGGKHYTSFSQYPRHNGQGEGNEDPSEQQEEINSRQKRQRLDSAGGAAGLDLPHATNSTEPTLGTGSTDPSQAGKSKGMNGKSKGKGKGTQGKSKNTITLPTRIQTPRGVKKGANTCEPHPICFPLCSPYEPIKQSFQGWSPHDATKVV